MTRFLLAAQSTSLPVCLVINKIDLVPAEEQHERLTQVESWGYGALPLSVKTGTGLDEVAGALKGRVSVVIGPSGKCSPWSITTPSFNIMSYMEQSIHPSINQ